MKTDTIAAIATALSPSGIGIIRISGEEAVNAADRIFRAKNKKSLKEAASHTIHYGYIVEGDAVIDEVLVMLMKAPNSYTREDTVEIDCHGGILVMQKILEAVIRHGARPAEAGEFTKRAFLNGRIDMAQAESVIDVINSKNEFALKSSLNQLRGTLSKKIQMLRKKIIHETAYLESAIDDPEHYSLEGYSSCLMGIVSELKAEIQEMLDTADNGRILKEGIHTVIVGKPNVGKSSILNVLAGFERAIVTDIAGTTRDILQEHVNLNGISLNIIDTAGIRRTNDLIEKIGVDKTKEYLEQADLVFYVVDQSVCLDKEDYEIVNLIKNKNVIILLNKSDLECKVNVEEIKQMLAGKQIVSVSAKKEEGIKEVSDLISNMFMHGNLSFNDEVVITSLRHKNALIEALESLKLVEQSIKNRMPEDFYSIDLLDAYKSLGYLIGESMDDDLVNEIFSKFCMGK